MKLSYLITAFLIMSAPLHATILREPPEGCPSIAEINSHKPELLKAKTNQTIQIGVSQFQLVYITQSKPSTSMEAYTYPIINPDFSGEAKCDYALRAPTHGLATHYFGLEPVK